MKLMKLKIYYIKLKDEGRELVPDTFKSVLFPLNQQKEQEFKYYFLKKCFKGNQYLFAHIKAGYNIKILLSDIRKIVYSLYQSKEITKKVYKKIIKSLQI